MPNRCRGCRHLQPPIKHSRQLLCRATLPGQRQWCGCLLWHVAPSVSTLLLPPDCLVIDANVQCSSVKLLNLQAAKSKVNTTA